MERPGALSGAAEPQDRLPVAAQIPRGSTPFGAHRDRPGPHSRGPATEGSGPASGGQGREEFGAQLALT
ncbi:hypothetical protein [Streptomyces sp. NPDC101181]|uniref:hypothetical protein n=1 Tax=Streptomyces sp. NPDC101181 TaxID=3366125 RepID=UPI003806C9DE